MTNDSGETALLMAAKEGQIEVVEVINKILDPQSRSIGSIKGAENGKEI